MTRCPPLSAPLGNYLPLSLHPPPQEHECGGGCAVQPGHLGAPVRHHLAGLAAGEPLHSAVMLHPRNADKVLALHGSPAILDHPRPAPFWHERFPLSVTDDIYRCARARESWQKGSGQGSRGRTFLGVVVLTECGCPKPLSVPPVALPTLCDNPCPMLVTLCPLRPLLWP